MQRSLIRIWSMIAFFAERCCLENEDSLVGPFIRLHHHRNACCIFDKNQWFKNCIDKVPHQRRLMLKCCWCCCCWYLCELCAFILQSILNLMLVDLTGKYVRRIIEKSTSTAAIYERFQKAYTWKWKGQTYHTKRIMHFYRVELKNLDVVSIAAIISMFDVEFSLSLSFSLIGFH